MSASERSPSPSPSAGGGGGGGMTATASTSPPPHPQSPQSPQRQSGISTAAAAAAAAQASMTNEELNTLLTHLSQKSGVHSVLILSRTLNGAVVKSIGIENISAPTNTNTNTSNPRLSMPPGALEVDLDKMNGGSGVEQGEGDLVTQYAGMVWRFLKSAEEMVGGVSLVTGGGVGAAGMVGIGTGGGGGGAGGNVNGEAVGTGGSGQEDDLQLLRVRTKRHELVIVPHPKYILVVIHDAPGARF